MATRWIFTAARFSRRSTASAATAAAISAGVSTDPIRVGPGASSVTAMPIGMATGTTAIGTTAVGITAAAGTMVAGTMAAATAIGITVPTVVGRSRVAAIRTTIVPGST